MLHTDWKNKTREERKHHFNERLLERYGISVSDNEYEDICTWVDGASKEHRDNCKRLLRLSYNLRAYRVNIKGETVLALYSKKEKMFTTALPYENYYDPQRMVPKIFRKKNLVKEAVREYNRVLEICSREYQDLGDSRKNWEYYVKCTYPKLMIDEYKNGLSVSLLYRQVITNMNHLLGVAENKIKHLI